MNEMTFGIERERDAQNKGGKAIKGAKEVTKYDSHLN